ncbi:imm11 family protein [Archangium lansingense]|uniref:imm11 family protein n=1 Tax=Archangium lansingense TaxID=2995310 RepID=UPI003B81D0A0
MTAQMKYYEMYDDVYIPGRWHLRFPLFKDGENELGREDDDERELFDTWRFSEGRVLEIERPIRLSVKPAGVALEYTEAMGIPIVHRRVVSLFERLGIQKEVQFIPVEVEGQTEPWFILNALQVIRCIDDARCEEVFYRLPEHGDPSRVGQYKNVRGLKVDPEKVGSANIFRTWGWLVVLIVSERVKSAMEQEGITGIKFIEV